MCLLYGVDVSVIVQHVWDSEEVARVKEKVLLIELIGWVWELAFFGACVHGRRGHKNLNYRKQSKRVIGMSLVMRYRPHFI